MSIDEIIYWLAICEAVAGWDGFEFAGARKAIILRERLRWRILYLRRGVAGDRHEAKSPNPLTREMIPIERRRRLVLIWLLRQAERAIRAEKARRAT